MKFNALNGKKSFLLRAEVIKLRAIGEMAEWFNAPVLKTGEG
jgi:hypothetical protein